MSIDLTVFPTSSDLIGWRDLKRSLLSQPQLLNNGLRDMQIDLVIIPGEIPMAEEAFLEPHTVYHIETGSPNSLILYVKHREEPFESYYLTDFGENLTQVEIEAYAAQWAATGITYILTSKAGNQEERLLFIALALALAENCAGRIIVEDRNIFSLDVGVYTPERFKDAQWIAS